MNWYRCENCKYRWNLPKGNLCPFQKEEVYYKLKEEVFIPSGTDLFTSIVGCASHSDFQAEREKVLDEVISLVNKNCFELEGKRLKITPLLLLQEIDKLRQEGKDGESR